MNRIKCIQFAMILPTAKNEIIHEERIPSNFSCVREGPAVDIMENINSPPVNGSLTDLIYSLIQKLSKGCYI